MTTLPEELIEFMDNTNLKNEVKNKCVTKKGNEVVELSKFMLKGLEGNDDENNKKVSHIKNVIDNIQQIDKTLEEEFIYEEFLSMVTPLILRVLTEKEIRGWNEFARTDIGKSFKEKLPNLVEEIMQLALAYGNMLKKRTLDKYPKLFDIPEN